MTEDEHECYDETWQCNDIIADEALCKASAANFTDEDKANGNRNQKSFGKRPPVASARSRATRLFVTATRRPWLATRRTLSSRDWITCSSHCPVSGYCADAYERSNPARSHKELLLQESIHIKDFAFVQQYQPLFVAH